MYGIQKKIIVHVLIYIPLITIAKCDFSLNTSVSSSKCILNIANKYFKHRPIVSIFTNQVQEDSSVFEGLLTSDKYTKRLFNLKKFQVLHFDSQAKYVLVVVKNLQELFNKTILNNFFLWSPRAKYVFYIHKTFHESIIHEFVQLLWYHYMVNSVILVPQTDYNNQINMYTFNPYSSCGKTISTEITNICTNGFFQNELKLFKKIPYVLNGCTIKVRAQIWAPLVYYERKFSMNETLNITEGIEVQMMNTLTKFLNLTPEYYSSTFQFDWGIVNRNGSASGAMKLLMDRKVDLAIGGFGAVTERRMYNDYTEIFYNEMISWCLPHAQLSPRWKQLFNTFQMSAWLAMLLTYFTISIIIWFLSVCQPKDVSLYSKMQHSFIYSYSIFLGVSANETPRKVSSRLSFFFWMVFSLHFIVAYQAKLVSVLLTPNYEKQISTLEEMVSSGLEHNIIPTHVRFFESTKDSRFDKIIEHLQICPSIDECLQRVAYKRDSSFLIMQTYAYIRSIHLRNENGDSLLYFIPYLMSGANWYMTKGYPLRDRLNTLIMRLRGSGLLYKWQKDIEERKLQMYAKTTKGDEQILTVSHMQGAFAILILGLSFSLIIFIIENVYAFLLNQQAE